MGRTTCVNHELIPTTSKRRAAARKRSHFLKRERRRTAQSPRRNNKRRSRKAKTNIGMKIRDVNGTRKFYELWRTLGASLKS